FSRIRPIRIKTSIKRSVGAFGLNWPTAPPERQCGGISDGADYARESRLCTPTPAAEGRELCRFAGWGGMAAPAFLPPSTKDRRHTESEKYRLQCDPPPRL